MLGLTHKLLSGSGDQLIAEIIRKALDPKDKDQAAMLKLCVDRMAPVTAFERADQGNRGVIELRVTVAAPEQSALPGVIENKSGGASALRAVPASSDDVIDVTPVDVTDRLEPAI